MYFHSLTSRLSLPFKSSIDLCIAEGTVTYTIGDTKVLDPIPLCSVFKFAPGTEKIQDYRAYIDLTPLFIAIGMNVVAGDDGKPTMVPAPARNTNDDNNLQ